MLPGMGVLPSPYPTPAKRIHLPPRARPTRAHGRAPDAERDVLVERHAELFGTLSHLIAVQPRAMPCPSFS